MAQPLTAVKHWKVKRASLNFQQLKKEEILNLIKHFGILNDRSFYIKKFHL